MKTRKIWIGIGAAISAQATVHAGEPADGQRTAGQMRLAKHQLTGAQSAPAALLPVVTDGAKAGAGSGGEGGEGGEAGARQGPMLEAANLNKVLAGRLVSLLREGGYVIYFRHFETGEDTPDYINATLGQCATQRQLNANGVAQAVVVRDVFQKLRFPIAKVYASPFCRAWQSADIAFGGHQIVENLKLPKAKSKDFSDAEKAQMRRALRPLLSAKPKSGTNTIIVAHDDNLPTVGAPYPESQGEALVFRPTGDTFALMMSVKPDVWPLLVAN